MTGERWSKVRESFEPALGRAPHERAEFVRRACAGDTGNLGAIACGERELESVHAYYWAALAIAQELGSNDGIAYALDGLGALAARRGVWARAARLVGGRRLARRDWL